MPFSRIAIEETIRSVGITATVLPVPSATTVTFLSWVATTRLSPEMEGVVVTFAARSVRQTGEPVRASKAAIVPLESAPTIRDPEENKYKFSPEGKSTEKRTRPESEFNNRNTDEA